MFEMHRTIDSKERLDSKKGLDNTSIPISKITMPCADPEPRAETLHIT
jgi:hypothetical protein